MEKKQLIFRQYILGDAKPIVNNLFARLNENENHIDLSSDVRQAAAYKVGDAGLQVEYLPLDGLEAQIAIGISAPSRGKLRAVQSYLFDLLREVAPDYNLLNIQTIRRNHIVPRMTKPEQ